MAKVLEFRPKKHVYELSRCAGCGKEIRGNYTELGLHSGQGDVVTHIALCFVCAKSAEKVGVI